MCRPTPLPESVELEGLARSVRRLPSGPRLGVRCAVDRPHSSAARAALRFVVEGLW